MAPVKRGKLTKRNSLRKIQPAKFCSGSNAVKIPHFGTKYSIYSVDKDGELNAVQIVPGNRPNKFLALFDSDDVDFEIEIDNSNSVERTVLSTLEIHNKGDCFSTCKSKICLIDSLESEGRKLHFLRKSSEEGDTFIATFAAKNGISFKKASHILSQIKVEVSYSKPLSKDAMIVYVNDFTKTFCMEVVPTFTIQEFKKKIKKFWGIKVSEQRLISKGKVLSDMKTLADYEIQGGNEIHMIRGLEGGRGMSTTSEDELTSDSYSDSDSMVFQPRPGRSSSGERGVIVLGDHSDGLELPIQVDEDEELGSTQFVIEVRKKTQFGFNG